ncbi:MAG: hypothetical protein IJA07_01920 [Agathobacter sp.]|nr:hypothetical protein [Agathobacter sp.]
MKRKLILCLVLCMCCLVGCGGNDDEKDFGKNSETQQESEKNTQESEKADLPYGSELGEGSIIIATPSGSSKDGNIPILLEEEGARSDSISMKVCDIDGSSWSYTYVDGILIDKWQIADAVITVSLREVHLTEGEHIVSLVQYSTNEEGGEIITYKEAKYKVEY